MSGVEVPYEELHRRAHALTPERQVAYALASAEHLVNVEASHREAELREALSEGWGALQGAANDLGPLHARLCDRDDLDDDEVAAVSLALRAALGSADDAWYAASRSLDAAYGRVAYEPKAREFRPLPVDTGEPVVQSEIAWHRETLTSLESERSVSELLPRLRS